MIDNIIIVKKKISEQEAKSIILKSKLYEVNYNGLKTYTNLKNKNFEGGLYIKIDSNFKLKISGSLHKYYNYLLNNSLTNHDTFTMLKAKETASKLVQNMGFNPQNAIITYYEVGANINNIKNNLDLIGNVRTIGELSKEKVFFINPRYKDNRCITTESHRDYRIYYKIYDKNLEMTDKKRKEQIENNIIRIETTNRRVENFTLLDLMDIDYLNLIKKKFFKTWDKLNFKIDIEAPKGTHTSKIELSKEMWYFGKNVVLERYKKQLDKMIIGNKVYYNVKKFVDNWEDIKYNYKPQKTDIHLNWLNCYTTEKQKLNL